MLQCITLDIIIVAWTVALTQWIPGTEKSTCSFCHAGGEGTRDREGVARGGGSGRNSGGGSGDSSTLTAASLIDAIITHQINQSSTDNPGSGSQGGTSNSPVPTRPGDRLFQV